MFLNDLKKFMIERGMKGFDFLFFFGFVLFICIFLKTNSFSSAIMLPAFVWVIALTIFLCYHFEIGDLGRGYSELKKNESPKGNRIINMFIFSSIFLVGILGGFFGVFVSTILLGYNGLVVGLGIALGATIALKLYYITILKKL